MSHRLQLLPLIALLCTLASCGTPGDRSASNSGMAAPAVAAGSAVSLPTMAPSPLPTSTLPPPATATPTSATPPTSTPTAAPTGTPTVAPEVVPTAPPASCPVTVPPDPPFVPPDPPTLFAGSFWYGTAALWTEPRLDGTWRRLPYYDGAFSQKIFWWRQGFNWQAEPQPNLVVTGRRLDAPASPLVSSRANSAFNTADIGSAMLVGVNIPTPGCWEITGEYAGTTLSFVVWVVP